MLKLLLLLCMKWAQSSPTELDHVVRLAPHTLFCISEGQGGKDVHLDISFS